MSKDKEIDELFKSFNPEVDAERIMTGISGKMDVIDMARPELDRMNRFHRTVAVCCFIVGLLAGCFLISMALFCADHRSLILTFLAAASFILGSLPLINSNEWSKSL